MNIVTREREKYEEAWTIPAYADFSPGENNVKPFLEMANLEPTWRDSVLDAGCGSGKGAVALHKAGFGDVRMCDLTDSGLIDEARAFSFHEACLWDDLRSKIGYLRGGKIGYVYCCDVMEHLPIEYTLLVVQRLLEVATHGVFLSISLIPDSGGHWAGQPLHLTVQSFVWWRDRIKTVGEMVECRDLLMDGIYYVRPRC